MTDFYTIYDLYQCPDCEKRVAEGDRLCRYCGLKFTKEHVAEMKTGFLLPLNIVPGNLRDVYRCVFCSRHVSVYDNFCRFCEREFDDETKDKMQTNLKMLARENRRSLISNLGIPLLRNANLSDRLKSLKLPRHRI